MLLLRDDLRELGSRPQALVYRGDRDKAAIMANWVICSNYYRQANAIDASVRKQIALDIVVTRVP